MINGRSHCIKQMAVLCLIILIISGVFANSVSGETYTWTGFLDSDWNTPDNWSPIGNPLDGDDVTIPATAPNQPVIYSTGTTNLVAIDIQAGASLNVTGGTLNIADDATCKGALSIANASVTFNLIFDALTTGTVSISSGAVTFNDTTDIDTLSISGSGTVNFNAVTGIDTLTFSDGTLAGTGTVIVASSFTWSGGTMSGAGITNLASGCNTSIDILANKYISARTLNNSGSVVFNDKIYLQDACEINNLSDGGAFDVKIDDAFLNYYTGSAVKFNNAGQLTKSVGTGTASINAIVDNTGTIDIQSGTLRFNQNSTNSGNTNIGAGAIFLFSTATHSFDTTATITGTGTINIPAGTVNFNINPDLSAILVSLSGGTVNFNGATALGDFSFSGGMLTGTGTVTVASSFAWSGGTMSGAGITNLASGCITSIDTGNNKFFSERTLNNGGSVVFNDIIYLQNACEINNLSGGGKFDVKIDGAFLNYNTGGAVSFNNAGQLTKSVGTGTASINAIVDNTNTGTIDIQSGTLQFNQNSTNNGNIQGTGVLDVSSVSFVNPGSISPGTSAGILSLTGNLPQEATSVLNIEIGGVTEGTQYDRLNVSGAATLAGTLDVTLINGFNPNEGDTFTILTYGSSSGSFDPINLPTLAGALAWDVTAGSSSIMCNVITTAKDNSPPTPPTADSPTDEYTFDELDTITLAGSSYNDPDGDLHMQTHWEVWRADSGEMVYQATSTTGPELEQLTLTTQLAPGLKYEWQVGYEDEAEKISWSEVYSFKVGTSVPETLPEIAAGETMADFGMISIVHWPDDPSPAKVFNINYDPRYYRIGAYDPISGGYIEFNQSLEIEPGRSYWMLAREGLSVNFNGIPVSKAVDIDVGLKYNLNGWNMIACPNDANYYWNDVIVVSDGVEYAITDAAVDALIDTRLWQWETGSYVSYLPGDGFLMEKYKGYWVKAKASGVYLRFPSTAQASLLNKPPSMLADIKERFMRYWYNVVPKAHEAIAEDQDTPPMPMGALEDNDTENIFSGCFVEVLSL